MTKVEIKERLNEIFIKTFGAEESKKITDNTQATDVDGWDSFAHMAILQEIEESFGVQFNYREIASFDRVGDIVTCLEKKLGE